MSKLTLNILAIVGMMMVGSQAFGALGRITGVTATQQGGSAVNSLGNTVNNSGLSFVNTDNTAPGPIHNNTQNNNAETNNATSWTFDFGSNKTVAEIWIWNCTTPNFTKRGIKFADFSYSTDNVNWTPLLDDQLIHKSPVGSDGPPPVEANTSSLHQTELGPSGSDAVFSPFTARYVRMSDLSNWAADMGSADTTQGMGEIQFFTPEPATMVFLGIGTLGTVLLRKTRR